MQRRSISVDTFAHKSPIPNACRIGNVIASGLIRGAEADGTFTPDMNRQCELMFQNMKTTVEAGGGSVDDIIKLTVWMEKLDRAPINAQWSKMFPDHDSRPARQVMETSMEPGVLIQCDFMAVLKP